MVYDEKGTLESVNSKIRKATDGKRVFPSDDSLLKSLYIVAVELDRKWSKRPISGWQNLWTAFYFV